MKGVGAFPNPEVKIVQDRHGAAELQSRNVKSVTPRNSRFGITIKTNNLDAI